MIKPNIGTSGRILRLLIAIALLVYAVWQLSLLAFLAALFTFYEVFASWCVVYQLLGKNSCPIDKQK